MRWWIYKCNNEDRPYQVEHGDWADFFDIGTVTSWGSTEWVPPLEQLTSGDMVIAYQTERNELVGLAKVDRLRRRGQYLDLYLEPLERIGVKIRPLKKADSRIAAIPALQRGPVKTVYDLSAGDAIALLRAAKSTVAEELISTHSRHEQRPPVLTFPDPEKRKRIEKAAIQAAKQWLQRQNYMFIKDRQQDNCGYDLLAKHCRSGKELHVEVKGTGEATKHFYMSRNEFRYMDAPQWRLIMVCDALDKPQVTMFTARQARRAFNIDPFAWVGTAKPGT
ncbi:MAG: DUF3883 domain-containing protein [Phycisphaeraceae bacterium]|nr:DUF3883 domain-containing protein [Phycisphaeraceae bacterium]